MKNKITNNIKINTKRLTCLLLVLLFILTALGAVPLDALTLPNPNSQNDQIKPIVGSIEAFNIGSHNRGWIRTPVAPNGARYSLIINARPVLNQQTLGVLQYNTQVHITARVGNFYRIVHNGRTGYIWRVALTNYRSWGYVVSRTPIYPVNSVSIGNLPPLVAEIGK